MCMCLQCVTNHDYKDKITFTIYRKYINEKATAYVTGEIISYKFWLYATKILLAEDPHYVHQPNPDGTRNASKEGTFVPPHENYKFYTTSDLFRFIQFLLNSDIAVEFEGLTAVVTYFRTQQSTRCLSVLHKGIYVLTSRILQCLLLRYMGEITFCW
jgi:hypothetical protein